MHRCDGSVAQRGCSGCGGLANQSSRLQARARSGRSGGVPLQLIVLSVFEQRFEPARVAVPGSSRQPRGMLVS